MNKKFKKLQSSNYDEKLKEKTFQRVSMGASRRQSNLFNLNPNKNNNRLKELLQENEDSIIEEEDDDIQDISFELSNVNDMRDFLDNFSEKSDEKIEVEFESTTNEEAIELIDDFLKESTKQMIQSKKGFDKDIKKISEEFYLNLIDNLSFNDYNIQKSSSLNKKLSKNSIQKINYLEKRPSYMFSESATSEENTPKFKHDLLKQNDTFQTFGKKLSFASKAKNISSKFILEEINENNNDNILKRKSFK